MIDIKPEELNDVIQVLKKNLTQDIFVYAFGSRTKQLARKYSDLDLLIKSDQAIPSQILLNLKDDFAESDIPFRVDVSDWHQLSSSFKQFIEKDKVRINF